MKIQIIEDYKFYRKATETVYTFPEELFDWSLGCYKALSSQSKFRIKNWLINHCKAVFYYTNKEKRQSTLLHKHKNK